MRPGGILIILIILLVHFTTTGEAPDKLPVRVADRGRVVAPRRHVGGALDVEGRSILGRRAKERAVADAGLRVPDLMVARQTRMKSSQTRMISS